MDLRVRLAIILLMSGVVALVWTFPQWQPFFINETQTEYFVGLELELQERYIGLSIEEREIYQDLQEEQPELALNLVRGRLGESTQAPEDEATFDEEGWTILRRGEFVEIDPTRRAEGNVLIYEFTDGQRIVRLEDFATFPGDDLHIILTRDPDPREIGSLDPDYIDLGEIKGTIGSQNYTLDLGIDLNEFLAVAIISERNQVVMSVATLR